MIAKQSQSQTLVTDACPVDVEQLTTEQMKKLLRFREDLESRGLLSAHETLGTDDGTLLRFLRARQSDLPAARKMITSCLRWRHNVEEVGIDTLYNEIDPLDFENREEVFKYWPMWFHKTDKVGRPINIQVFGAFDVARLHQVVQPEFHWKTILVNCELLTREVLPGASRAAGRRIDGAYCIVDLQGFSLTQFWQIKTLARACFGISQDRFPETLGHLAIINAPSAFTSVWHIISKWLAKETVAKISVLGSDYAEELLKAIQAENLPKTFGGKCECHGGCHLSSAGPWMEGRDWENQSWKVNYDAEGRMLHEKGPWPNSALGNGSASRFNSKISN